METTTNYIEDGGFESGAFESGVLYGNWSEFGGSGWTFNSDEHSGIYALYGSSATGAVIYNFTTPILGADIEAFNFWAKNNQGAGSYDTNFVFYYSDATTGAYHCEINDLSYVYFDLIGAIDTGKYLTAFSFSIENQYTWYDDFYLGIQDQYSQDQYGFTTYPWRTTGLATTWQQLGYNEYGLFGIIPLGTAPIGAIVDVDYIGHNLVWGRNSNGSGYIGYDESTAQFIQDIDYADTDDLHYFDLWAYAQGDANIGVKVVFVYSDRTHDTKTLNITASDSWVHLNYGKSWISSNKYLINIQISLANYYSAYVNIDDIGLWSEVPANYVRFTYSVSPSPIQTTTFAFTSYQGVPHVFYGYLWDENQTLTEDGTYSVSTNYGSTSGSITDGQFSFNIVSRVSSTGGDITEQIIITMTVNGEIIVINITATWLYAGGQGDTGDGDTYINTPVMNFFVMFIIVFVPPLGLAFEFSAKGVNPMLGFIGGLLLMTAIGYMSGLTPLWFLFICILVTVLFMLAMFRSFARGGVTA